MTKKRIFSCAAILCFFVFLGLLGAASLYGQDGDEVQQPYEGAFFNSASHSMINTEDALIVVDEALTSFSGRHLREDIVIAPTQPDFDIVVTGISGEGNIVIVSGYDGRVLLNNVNITGDIVIADMAGFANLTLNNSNANSIVLYAAGRINVLTMDERARPNVVINAPGVHLTGNFNRVESNIHDGLIFINGEIGGFYAEGNVILVGTGSMEYVAAPEYTIVEIFDPNASCCNQDITDELLAAMDGLFSRHLGRLEFNLLDNIGYMISNISFPSITFPSMPAPTIVQLPPAPTPSPSPSPSPSPPSTETPILTPPPSPPPTPSPGDGNGFTPPAGYTRISAANILNIMPPNILPVSLLPSHLTNNVQRSVTGDGFTGAIDWFYINGTELTGGTFTLGMRYIAVITLTPNSMRYFAPDIGSNIDTSTVNNIWYSRTNQHQDVFTHDKVVFRLIFDPTGRWTAGEFSLGDIEGPFNRIYVYTHYLGGLNTGNFSVNFNGSYAAIDEVSLYNTVGGYYVITLVNTLTPAAGAELRVRFLNLPYHYHPLYRNTASTTPQPGIPTGPLPPSLGASTAPLGGRVPLNNFPLGTNLYVYLSIEAFIDHDCVFWQNMVMGNAAQVTAFYPSSFLPTGFYVPADAIQGSNFVYIVDRFASPPTVELIGMLNVEPSGGRSFIDISFIDLSIIDAGIATTGYPQEVDVIEEDIEEDLE